MYNLPQLKIPLTEFEESITAHLSEGEDLSKLDVQTEEALLDLNAKKENWILKINEILTTFFDSPHNDYIVEFKQTKGAKKTFSNVPGVVAPIYFQAANIKEEIRAKVQYLQYNYRLILASDYIARPSVDLSQRSKYTMQEKMGFVLQKLYELNDEFTYPVGMLLEGNGIKLRDEEIREMLKILESNNYIKVSPYGRELAAKITVGGTLFVEEQMIAHHENYERVANDKEELANTINNITTHLNNLGIGQEILFEELQELKDLYGKLDKKNWGQLLKGKLVDLALGKVVEPDTLKFVYEQLTGNELNLLG